MFYVSAHLYASVILQGICVNGPIPLFYEMAIEANYPISENVTSGMLSVSYNLSPLLFLAVFFIPKLGTKIHSTSCVVQRITTSGAV